MTNIIEQNFVSYKTDLYFECHVTIEPVFDDDLIKVRQIGNKYGFRTADLLMKKRANDTKERSQDDTFMTGRDKNYITLMFNMKDLISDLRRHGFKVWRYKIENTLLDSKEKDELELFV